MNCPVCKTVELKVSDRSGIEIDYCPQCRGVWLDRGELDKIIERSATYESQIRGAPRDERPYEEKRKNDDYYEYDRDRYDYDDDHRRYPPNDPRSRKKKSFLGEVFDIFD